MRQHPKGTLIIIGGHEDKEGDQEILQHVVEQVKRLKGNLVLVTAATHLPEEVVQDYKEVFHHLGITTVDVVDVRTHEDGFKEENIKRLHENSVLFFSGGDQLRITSQLGASPLYQRMIDIYNQGATIVGTSAGAAAMPITMIVSGPGDESADNETLSMAPGLGLLPGVVIDSHFAQRGRIGRLLGTVAQNPKNLGIGIDEDTAIIVEQGAHFSVVGSRAVYVVDGSGISYSSLSESTRTGIIGLHNVKLHVLRASDCFDLETRRPVLAASDESL